MFIAPKFDSVNKVYITGQDLTLNQMIGKDPLGVKKSKYMEVINPQEQYPVIHNTKLVFDEKEPSIDRDFYNFYLTISEIADKKSVKEGIHDFYMEDLEQEAVEGVNKFNLVYDVLAKVKKDTSVSRYKDIAIFLGYSATTLSATVIEDKILSECMKNPDKVNKFFIQGSEDIVFVRKLKLYELIDQRRDSFYRGEIFLGRTIEEVSKSLFENKNKDILGLLTDALSKKEG